jgi:hypothetical protein
MSEKYGELNSSYGELSGKYSALLNANNLLLNNYSRLSRDYHDLYSKHSKLEVDYSLLNASYSAIQVSPEQLVSKYLRLSSDFKNLNESFVQLKAVYDQGGQLSSSMLGHYTSLSGNVSTLRELLLSYSSIPQSFPRVLNYEAVKEISKTVLDATDSSKDSWSAYQKIYDYITTNVKNVKDIDMPYISGYWYVVSGGYPYITSFSLDEIRDYVQAPGLTVEIEQGDCEDQAVLAYAMIQYYRNDVLGSFSSLYLAEVKFADGSGHVAVIMPVADGEICIIDPTGKYLTSAGGQIASKKALEELKDYSNYWSQEVGQIASMKLFYVDITDGSHQMVAEGDAAQIAAFLK